MIIQSALATSFVLLHSNVLQYEHKHTVIVSLQICP